MKKILLIFLLFVTLLGIGIFIYLRNSYKEPVFITIKISEIVQTDNTSASIKATALFHNPNLLSAQLINTQLRVFSNDIHVAEVSQTQLSDIHPNSDFEVPLSFDINLLNLGLSQGLSGLIGQMLNEEKKIPVKFEGYCRIKSQGKIYKIPIVYEDELVFK